MKRLWYLTAEKAAQAADEKYWRDLARKERESFYMTSDSEWKKRPFETQQRLAAVETGNLEGQ